MVEYIDALGWGTYSFDHEGGQGQYEFDFGYTDVLTMADRMVVFRLMAKHVARSLGCIASFMPKPWSEAFGSGAHLNVSLSRNGQNAFIGNSVDNSYSAGCLPVHRGGAQAPARDYASRLSYRQFL